MYVESKIQPFVLGLPMSKLIGSERKDPMSQKKRNECLNSNSKKEQLLTLENNIYIHIYIYIIVSLCL